MYDLIIIGGGAAGFGAGVYAGRYELSVALFEGPKPGGETATGGKFENYPGIVAIDGYDLYQQMRLHAGAVGTKVMPGTVTAVSRDGGCFSVRTDDGKERHTASVIFAHGQSRRYLGLPNEEALTGHGVSYCATCDGPLYKGKIVAVVGGGDASVKGVNLLAEYAHKIYLIVRGDAIIAEPVNETRMRHKGNKVEILFTTEVKELIEREGKFTGVRLSKQFSDSDRLMLDGLFIEIGAKPETVLPEALGLTLNDKGYIHVDQFQRTNVRGVFAAGDCTDGSGDFRQAIMAAAQGSMAATSAYEYVRNNGNLCEEHAKPPEAANQES